MSTEKKRSPSQLAARGAFSILLVQVLSLVSQFLGDIFLARMLAPSDFGLVAMSLAVTGIALQFRDLGLSAAAVQTKELGITQSSNLFWCNTGLGLLLALVLVLLSPGIAKIYSKPELGNITVALASVLVLSAAGVQHQVTLARKLRFATISFGQLSGIIFGYVAAGGLAWAGVGYWAIVASQVIRATVPTVLFWICAGWVPHLPTKDATTTSLLKTGGSVAGFDLVNYFSRNTDKFLVGKICGEDVLGHYNRAYQLLLLPISQLRAPLVTAAMPILSRLVHSPDQFARLFTSIVAVLATVSIPIICWMGVHSHELILLLLGSKWIETGRYFPWLSIAGIIQPSIGMMGLLLITTNQGRRYLMWGLWHSGIMISSMIIGIFWGANGMIIAYAIANYLAAIPSFYFCTNGTMVDAKGLVFLHLYPIVFAALASLSSILLRRAINCSMPVELLVGSLVFSACYLMQFFIIKKQRLLLFSTVKTLLQRGV